MHVGQSQTTLPATVIIQFLVLFTQLQLLGKAINETDCHTPDFNTEKYNLVYNK
jgi:hypothetical protein